MLVENTSKNTTLVTKTIEQIENPQAKRYTQSDDDEKIVAYVAERKRLMAAKRTNLDKNWKQYVKQYEATFVPYSDWRASSNVPLERAIIDLFVAEAVKRPTKYNFTWGLDFSFQEQILEKVWKDDWSVNNRNSEILDNEYLTAIFWSSIIFTWYNKHYRIISDFEWEDENWKIKFQRKLRTKSDILLKNIDIRHFWVDEKAKNMDQAVDCVYEKYITYEEFLNLYLDKNYDKEKLEAILPNKSEYDDYKPFTVKEELWEWGAKFVKITMYWNTKLDTYVEVANDSIKIKEHPILNATHCLPFTVRQYEKNLFSIYWTWLCELLVTFKSDINTLREMIMEAIKKSNQETIAIWSNLTFDWNQFAYNNQFLKFKWNLDQNFKQLSWTPPNAAIFNRLQDLFKELAVFVGLDIMNILWDAQQTAYQTAVQKESSLQRVNVVLRNRDEAFERLADQHKNNLQQFYPLKMVRELIDIDDEDNEIEEVDKDGNELWKKEATYPTIQVPKMKWERFLDTDEKINFEITPEKIRWKIKIDVSTDLNAPTINEVEKAQRMEFYNWLKGVNEAYAGDPDLEKIIPKKKAILDLAKLNNIETAQSKDAEASEEKAKLYDELKNVMWSIKTPDIAPEQEANLAEVSPDWQPPEVANLRTPKI